ELTRHDVVLVFLEQRTHDLFQLFRQFESFDFCWVAQAVHHARDTSVFQSFSDHFHTVLHEFSGIARFNTFFNHLVERKDRSCLQQATKDSLFTHQVRFHFSYERGFQYARTVTTDTYAVSFSVSPSFAFRVVFRVYGDQGRNTEASQILGTHFRARTFRSYHDYGNILTDLHTFLYDVETVRV